MMTAAASAPSLLGLPRELRDHICSHLIEHSNGRAPPPSPPFSGSRFRGSHDIMYPKDHTIKRFPLVAFVNRQLWYEVKDIVYLPSQGHQRPRAELDLMAKGYAFYPTWTRLPGCISRGNPLDLKVNLRIFSTEAFRRNDGWPRQPGAGFRTLLALLNNFMCSGPSLEPPADSARDAIPYCIDTLFVHITFHDLYTPNTWPGTSQEILRILCELARSGIPYPHIQTVKAVTEFVNRNNRGYGSQEWPVAKSCNLAKLEKWEENGFHFLLHPGD